MTTEPTGNSTPLLNPAQRRLLAIAISFLSVAIITVLLVASFLLFSKILSRFSAFLAPLAIAGIIALVIHPLVDKTQKLLRLNRPLSVTILYILFALAAAAIALALIPPLIDELVAFALFIPDLLEKTIHFFQQNTPAWLETLRAKTSTGASTPKNTLSPETIALLKTQIHQLISNLAPTLKTAGASTLHLLGILLQLLVTPIYLFYFLLSKRDLLADIDRHLSFIKPSLRHDLLFLTREFIAIIVSFFRGQLIVCLIIGSLMALGFTLVGLKYGLFIGLAIGLLNLIPYLGSTLGLLTIIPLGYFQPDGGLSTMLLSVAVFSAVQFCEGWFITPRIMGNRTGLHPLVIIIALLFWPLALDSILGVMFAVPLTAFFVTAWRLIRLKYLTRAT